MDAELKKHLEDMEGRLEGKLDAAEQRLEGKLDAAEQRLKDFIRDADHDLETTILTEFHKWGRTSDMRTREALTHAAALAERMLAVEDRVSALERRTH